MQKIKNALLIVIVLVGIITPATINQVDTITADEKIEKRGGPSHPIIDT